MFALGFAFLLAGPVAPPTPHGVNGSTLGKAEDFAIKGPARICTGEIKFDLEPGESVFLVYSGIHNLQLKLTGAFGTIELTEGDAWARPRNRNAMIFNGNGFRFYDVGDEAQFRYLAYGQNRYSEGDFVPMLWLDGTALKGNRSDIRLLRRFQSHDGTKQDCKVVYSYGWGVILEGEPFFEKKQ